MRHTARATLLALGLVASVAHPVRGQCNLPPAACGACRGGCSAALPVQHAFAVPCSPDTGSFDLRGTRFETTCSGRACQPCVQDRPPLRYWAFDSAWLASGPSGYLQANRGCHDSDDALPQVTRDLCGPAAADGHWVLWQAGWQAPELDGCPTSPPLPRGPLRTVAEIAAIEDEGSPVHRSWYLVAAVEGDPGFDFDGIRQADVPGPAGDCRASIPDRDVAGLSIVGHAGPCSGGAPLLVTPDARGNLVVEVAFDDPAPPWFTEIGVHDPLTRLIEGYEVVYRNEPRGVEPTTSERFAASPRPWTPVWSRALDPATGQPLDVATWGLRRLKVAVPSVPGSDAWLATRIVYADCGLNGSRVVRPGCAPDPAHGSATDPRLGSHVSAHCGPVRSN